MLYRPVDDVWRDSSGDCKVITSTNCSSSETRFPVAVENNGIRYEILFVWKRV